SLISAFVNSGYFDLVAEVDAGSAGSTAGSRRTRPTTEVERVRSRDDLGRVLVDAPGPPGTASNPPELTADALMDRDDVRIVLVIPSGFARALHRGESSPVQVLLNGDNANTATTVMGYATTIIRGESAKYAPPTAAAPLISVEPRIWYNPELRSALFLVPG